MKVKKGSTTFLKVIIFLVGMAVLALCIWLPEMAVRDAKVHPNTAYFLIPFVVCAYGFFITFLIVLYQVFKLLTYIERNNAFSELSLRSLKVIQNCAVTVIFFIVLGIGNLMLLAKVTGEDAAGPISLSLMGILVTSTIAAFINVLQKPIKHLLKENEIKM